MGAFVQIPYFYGSFRLDGIWISISIRASVQFSSPKWPPQANDPKEISYVRQNAKFEKGQSCINFEDFWIVFWSPTECFQSRAPGKTIFQGLSSWEMSPLDESFQGLCLVYFQHEAPEFLRKIIPSFREMCALRSSSHSLMSKGVPHTIWPKLSNLSNI